MKSTTLTFVFAILLSIGLAQQRAQVNFYTDLMMDDMFETNMDTTGLREWLHFNIVDVESNQVLFEDSIVLSPMQSYERNFCLEEGEFKVNVFDMGAWMNMPTITLSSGEIVAWGYPEYEYYLFEITPSMLSLQPCAGLNLPIVYGPPVDTTVQDTGQAVQDTIQSRQSQSTTVLDFQVDAQNRILQLDFENKEAEHLKVYATDYMGKELELFNQVFMKVGLNVATVDLSALGAGVYFITPVFKEEKFTRKIKID